MLTGMERDSTKSKTAVQAQRKSLLVGRGGQKPAAMAGSLQELRRFVEHWLEILQSFQHKDREVLGKFQGRP